MLCEDMLEMGHSVSQSAVVVLLVSVGSRQSRCSHVALALTI